MSRYSLKWTEKGEEKVKFYDDEDDACNEIENIEYGGWIKSGISSAVLLDNKNPSQPIVLKSWPQEEVEICWSICEIKDDADRDKDKEYSYLSTSVFPEEFDDHMSTDDIIQRIKELILEDFQKKVTFSFDGDDAVLDVRNAFAIKPLSQ